MELLKFDLTLTELLAAFCAVAWVGAFWWAIVPAIMWCFGWL